MAQDYPNTQGFAYSFARAEATVNGNIYTAISGVEIDQPTEREAVKGTKPFPLAQTEGTMGLGEGTLTFSDYAELLDMIDSLGDGYRQKTWTLSWVLRDAQAGREKKIECFGCCLTSEPISHEEGAEALGGDVNFSFMRYTIDGKSPHLA